MSTLDSSMLAYSAICCVSVDANSQWHKLIASLLSTPVPQTHDKHNKHMTQQPAVPHNMCVCPVAPIRKGSCVLDVGCARAHHRS